jgi:hypothetical protein
MSNNLWVLGDSFAELGKTHESWQIDLAKKLELNLINISINGCGIDWLMLKWDEICDKISSDDYLVVLIPFPDRVCFFPERPSLSGLASLDRHIADGLNSNQATAVKDYFMWLHNPIFNNVRITAWTNWVDHVATKLKNKPIILHTTNYTPYNKLSNCEVATGDLFSASQNEFKNYEEWNLLTSNGSWIDPRVGHFTEQNHQVLANKLLDFWKNSIHVNLENGWYSSVFSSTNQ